MSAGLVLENEARPKVLDKPVDASMGRHPAGMVPSARLPIASCIGHVPFREDPPRLKRELAELARSVRST